MKNTAPRTEPQPSDYRQRALEHAPQTADEITQAVLDLAAAGYSDHTIAGILQANVNSVRQLLGERVLEASK
jgi:hypothetical protein